ncbi:MAG: T9SS type A sorting domain-containing protein [Bacteroidetes bacterium]|nr:T9SS type A sorting domain-containing protein [Bacteroidota bacterium]
MKKVILLFLLLPVFASAQIVNIPDANFKAYLVGNTGINTNGDGEIQVTEATAFTGTINVTFKGISDLTGIGAFTSLTKLWCQSNSLTTLDVSSNTALTQLYCQANSLTSLNVSQNTALISLYCNNNLLTSLDVSNNTALTALWCNDNSLTGLDVRNGNYLNMVKFNATNNPNLYCISVDDEMWSNANWSIKIKDSWAVYSNNCTVGIADTPSNQPSITSYSTTITIKGQGTTTIFNLRGQRVHYSKLTGKASISLDRGIYLVRVTSEGKSVTKKVYLNN